MSKIIIASTCPLTKQTLYVSDVKPCLLQVGDKGDWGYSHKADQAMSLTIHQADQCMKDLREVGRLPSMISV